MSHHRETVGTHAAPLLKLAKKRKFDELESAWMTAIEDPDAAVDDLVSVLEVLLRFEQPDLAESLLWCLVTARAESAGIDGGLEAVRQGAPLLPTSAMLREEALELYRRREPEDGPLEALAELTLQAQGVPLPTAVARLDKLLSLRAGSYTYDKSVRRAGRVIGFDPEKKALEVEESTGARAYTAAASDRLELLPVDDFRALEVFERPRLEALAAEDPVELVCLTLKSFRSRQTSSALKAKLEALLPSAWSTWWADARVKLAQSGRVDMSEEADPMCVLRTTAVPYEVQLKARFDGLQSLDEKLVLVLEYLEQKEGDSPETAGFLRHLSETLAAPATWSEVEDPGMLLAIRALLARLGEERGAEPPALESPLQVDLADPGLLRNLESDAIVGCILAHIQTSHPDTWPEVYAALLPGCSRKVCEQIAEALVEADQGPLLRRAVAPILKRRVRHLRALVWLFRGLFDSSLADFLADLDKSRVALAVLKAGRNLMRRDASDERVKRLLTLVRNAISSGNYARIRRVIADADLETAKAIKSYVEHNSALTDGSNKSVLDLLRDRYPALFHVFIPRWKEDVIYTTEEGLDRKRNELLHLTTEKLPAIAQEIGKAAELGDLSENAEFTAALETRDRLAARATSLQDQIAKARLIPAGRSPVVTVGSRVSLRSRASDEEREYTFLGPWDADPERGIVSYLSPLGAAFMGAKVGDTVRVELETQKGVWDILEIG